MGYTLTGAVVQALRQHGIQADLAQPGSMMPILAETAAAVSLYSVDSEKQEATALVTVLTPKYLGAAECETAALRVGSILQGMDAACKQEACQYQGKTELFAVRVFGTFSGTALPEGWTEVLGLTVKLGDATLQHPVTFTAWQDGLLTPDAGSDEDTGEESEAEPAWEAPGWNIRLEEFFPPEAVEPDAPKTPFSVKILGPYQSETYLGCQWSSCRRVTEATGTRQIREGTAGSRMVSKYL